MGFVDRPTRRHLLDERASTRKREMACEINNGRTMAAEYRLLMDDIISSASYSFEFLDDHNVHFRGRFMVHNRP